MPTELQEESYTTTEIAEQHTQGEIQSLGQSAYRVRVIRSETEFAELREEWDGFLHQTGLQNLCMTHGWLNIYLNHFSPQKLLIIVVQDDQGRWVGIAPLQIKPSRKGLAHRLLQAVQWIGTNPTVFDWMQFMVHPQANEQAVIEAIASVLLAEKWDLLDLRFCHNNAQLETLLDILTKAFPIGTASAITECTQIPYLQLPATVAEYEAMRRKKTRLEVNRHKNRFAKEFGAPPTLAFVSSSEATEAILTRFFARHIQYWAERGEKSDFQRFPALFQFYKDMLTYSEHECGPDEPKLLLSVLTVANYQLSYHLGFWQGKCYLSHLTNYNQGFKSYSPGTIHMDSLVFEALERGGTEFEFGRGDEPYKAMWTKSKKPLWQLRFYRNPLIAALWQVDILLKKLLRKGSE